MISGYNIQKLVQTRFLLMLFSDKRVINAYYFDFMMMTFIFSLLRFLYVCDSFIINLSVFIFIQQQIKLK